MQLPARDFSLIFGGRMRIVRMSVIASAFLGLLPSCYAATGERFVTDHTVVSRHDPAVKIKVSDSVRYVGSDRFDFTKPELGTFDAAELFAFADGNKGEPLRKYIWVQFEGYLPGHPDLHFTYDSPQHVTIDGLDFYEDIGVASPTPLKPVTDSKHFYSLLASHGYERDDLMWVRLVHLDATKRKEIMIIYAESLAPTGYAASQLKQGGAAHARWAAMAAALSRRAIQSIQITRNAR
jgi:hypothetical protein